MKYLIILFLIICPLFYWVGEELRWAQEVFYQLSVMVLLFCSLFKEQKQFLKPTRIDLWLGIFGIWTVSIFVIFKCTLGYNYIINILLGIILYFICIKNLRKEDISLIFKAVLWVCVLNLWMLFFQAFGYDPVFTIRNNPNGTDFIGFFGLKAAMGMYFALALPLLASLNWWLSFLFFIPLWLSVSTGAMLAGGCAYLFYLWNKQRLASVIFFIISLIAGSHFIIKVDSPMGMFSTRPPMWKMVLRDSMQTPYYGYGLDSFRDGNIKYLKESTNDITHRAFKNGSNWEIKEPLAKDLKFDIWDNPHNEFLQLLYEFGIIGFIIIGFILYSIVKRFRQAVRTIEVVAIMSLFIAVLVMSTTQFPMHLSRIGHLIPIMLALFVIETTPATPQKLYGK